MGKSKFVILTCHAAMRFLSPLLLMCRSPFVDVWMHCWKTRCRDKPKVVRISVSRLLLADVLVSHECSRHVTTPPFSLIYSKTPCAYRWFKSPACQLKLHFISFIPSRSRTTSPSIHRLHINLSKGQATSFNISIRTIQ